MTNTFHDQRQLHVGNIMLNCQYLKEVNLRNLPRPPVVARCRTRTDLG